MSLFYNAHIFENLKFIKIPLNLEIFMRFPVLEFRFSVLSAQGHLERMRIRLMVQASFNPAFKILKECALREGTGP